MLTIRETATALAALRYWQAELLRRGDALTNDSLYFEHATPLSPVEIDGLCEWLNLAEPCPDEPVH